jgi:hypothetical protein
VQSIILPLPQLSEPGPGRVVPDEEVQKVLDSRRPKAEIYSWSMYPVGFGLPILLPTPVEVGSFGYFQDGKFKSLNINILEGDDDQLFRYAKALAAVGKPKIASGYSLGLPGGIVCPSGSGPTALSPRQDRSEHPFRPLPGSIPDQHCQQLI